MQAVKPKEQSVFDNEEIIIRSFRAGDRDAFNWIYGQMSRQLIYFVEKIIFSHTDAEDIVSNAFYKLFKVREGLKSTEHIKRWLFVTVRNESIDYLRARRRQHETSHEVAYLARNSEEQTETERVKALLLHSVMQEIEKLPRQRRKILRLYFFEQKTTAEIAELMGLNSQTVLNHKAKALESLRKTGLKFKWLMDGVSAFLLAIAFHLVK